MIPVLPTRDAVLLPGAVTKLRVGRPCSVAALRWAMEHDGRVVVVLQRVPEVDAPGPADLHALGTVGEVLSATRESEHAASVTVVGLERVQLTRVEPSLLAEVKRVDWRPAKPDMPEHFPETLRAFVDDFLRPQLSREDNQRLRAGDELERLAAIASTFCGPDELQEMLGSADLSPVVRELYRAAHPSTVDRLLAWFRRE